MVLLFLCLRLTKHRNLSCLHSISKFKCCHLTWFLILCWRSCRRQRECDFCWFRCGNWSEIKFGGFLNGSGSCNLLWWSWLLHRKVEFLCQRCYCCWLTCYYCCWLTCHCLCCYWGYKIECWRLLRSGSRCRLVEHNRVCNNRLYRLIYYNRLFYFHLQWLTRRRIWNNCLLLCTSIKFKSRRSWYITSAGAKWWLRYLT